MLHGLRLSAHRSLRPDRVQWILATCRLAAEHDSVGAVPDRIGHIADLCPRRHRGLDHALAHLGGCDDKETGLLGSGYEQLLRKGHTVDAQFHSKVPASDHQSLRLRDDAVDVRQCLGLLDLGADLGPLLFWNLQPVHDVDELLKVLGLLREGNADVLHRRIQLQQELRILYVLLGQSCAVDLHIRDIDSLPGLQFTSLDNLNLHLRERGLLNHSDLHQAVLDQQVSADHSCLHQGILFLCGLHSDATWADKVLIVLADPEL
mmetsp:Transcript_51169/g.111071  ORF Transcript_51169/g.111071 Transcript_51169/m.111071 type:complete len:262 (+) Transcript_51169:729-1514(+)